MEVFYLIGSVQAFFLATLFFSKKKVNTPQRLLIGVFIIIGLLLLDHYLELSDLLYQYPHLLGLTYSLPLLLGPALLLYTLLHTRNATLSIKRFSLIHIWPFLLSNIFLFTNYYFLSATDKISYYEQQTSTTSLPILMIELLLVLAIPIYSVWSIFLIQKYKKDIRNKFSNTDDISLNWWEVILICFVLLSAASIMLSIMSDGFSLIAYQFADNITMGGLTLAIFFIGYYGIKQKAIYLSPDPELMTKKVKPKEDIDDSSIQKIINALKDEKLYLNSTLTLREMAEHLETTENKLSYLINNGLNKSFYDLINEYRVEEVKRLLLDEAYDHLSILGIAFESGFNSKSSFQHVFRKHTGMTPSQFKKLQSDKSKSTY